MVIFGFSKILFLFYISKFFQNSPPLLPMTSGLNYMRNSFNYGIVRTVILETFLSLPQKSSRRWFYSLHHNSKANSDEIEPMWGKNLSETYYFTAKMLTMVSHLIYRLEIRTHEFIFSENCLNRKRCVQMRRFRNLNWTKFKSLEAFCVRNNKTIMRYFIGND